MKLSLSENIRSLRKQRKMTQEKLAEALGVTVGAVYKWESGQSQPELNLLVEMADFFDISVDALLGYRIRDNRMESARERINAYCQTYDPAAISEAEMLDMSLMPSDVYYPPTNLPCLATILNTITVQAFLKRLKEIMAN